MIIFLLKTWLDAGLHQAKPYPGNQAFSIVAWLGGVAALISAAVSAASGGGTAGNSCIVWGVSLLLLGLTANVVDKNL